MNCDSVSHHFPYEFDFRYQGNLSSQNRIKKMSNILSMEHVHDLKKGTHPRYLVSSSLRGHKNTYFPWHLHGIKRCLEFPHFPLRCPIYILGQFRISWRWGWNKTYIRPPLHSVWVVPCLVVCRCLLASSLNINHSHLLAPLRTGYIICMLLRKQFIFLQMDWSTM